MTRTARDLMQTHLITLSPDTPLLNAQRLFVDEEINGAPVIDETGKLLGVVSTLDILRAVEEEHDTASSYKVYFHSELEFSGPDWSSMPEDFQDRLGQLTVAEAMTKGGVTVSPDTSIVDLAKHLRTNRIHRALVLENDQLVGIISTFDLLATIE